jgi:uncharacterized iron-regulated membrane protein
MSRPEADTVAGFRDGIAWLHTWAGVIVGSVLFAIFWMGTLSVFDQEIDRWMMPATRLPAAPKSIPLDATILPLLDQRAPNASQWLLRWPEHRIPVLRLMFPNASGALVTLYVDPTTGEALPDPGTLGGSGFFFPFHYTLNLPHRNAGIWLVGLAGMAMLALLVSGVIIHRKIFREFFTFRPDRSFQRASLDLHNVLGVLGLPFHFVITLSGLIIFFSIYFPSAFAATYGGNQATFFSEAFDIFSRPKAGRAEKMESLDAPLREAMRIWAARGNAGEPYVLRVMHPGDANAYVEVNRSFEDRVTMTGFAVYIDGGTGEVLRVSHQAPILVAQRFVAGLHFIQFEHWTLRWLYFLAGLAGCVTIATGLIVWLEARRKRHKRLGLAGVRIVEGLTVGSTAGIVVATLAFFVVNRVLSPDASLSGLPRASLEVTVFYLVWLATFAHAWLRSQRAWVEQCWAIAGLSCAAVMLNWATTGDHLLQSLSNRYRWPVAGMDALLLMTALAASLTAWRARNATRRVPDPVSVPARGD